MIFKALILVKTLRNRLVFFIMLCGLILPSWALSATLIKVKKTKGNQALIESNSVLQEGKTYTLVENNPSNLAQTRQNSISLGLQMNILKGDRVQENSLAIEGRYGWNLMHSELGPLIEIISTNFGAGTDTSYLVGGYYDYNLSRNQAPETFIYGPHVSLSYGSNEYAAGGSATILQAQLGGFFTWYLQGSSTGLRAEGGYQLKQVSASTGNTDITGFHTKIFLIYSF